MANTPAFIKAFPLTARAAVHTPLVFRAGLYAADGLPWPSLEGIRDFAHFARVEDGAIRTALSRGKRDGSLFVEADSAGLNRYSLTPATFAMGTAQIRADQRPEGFLLAVFSFTTPEQEERASLRALLKSFGFHKLAQNTYIHGRIETEGLKTAIRELGLENNFFLFTCPDIDDENLVARVISLFDLESRRKKLSEYLGLLEDFLPEDLSGDEFARRLLYVGAVHWENIEASEPPIPAKYLPADYAFKEIQAFYGLKLEKGRAAMLGYFRRVFGG